MSLSVRTSISNPLVSDEALKKLMAEPMMTSYISVAYSSQWHERRVQFTSPGTSRDSVIHLTGLPGGLDDDGVFSGDKLRTWLHYAALVGDTVLVMELVRLGACVDFKDITGQTPLLFGMRNLKAMDHPSVYAAPPGPREEVLRTIERVAWICCVLIQQHAEVNAEYQGDTPLHFACASLNCRWDLVTLLLQYGADPHKRTAKGLPVDCLRADADKRRFRQLVNQFGGQLRPPRLCPCLSGKSLIDCHSSARTPYPLEFMCRCGSSRIYRQCCYTRGIRLHEQWDEAQQCIVIWKTSATGACVPTSSSSSQPLCSIITDQFSYVPAEVARQLCNVRNGGVKELYPDMLQTINRGLVPRGVMDPAFAYALFHADFIPMPGGGFPNNEMGAQMSQDWNNLVDDYMAAGYDPRPRIKIERAAKIGIFCGPFYRECEGVGCSKLEGREVQVLRICSACKLAVYCGTGCQRSAWPAHKTVCGKEGQEVQMLSSQKMVQEFVLPALAGRMSKMNK
ncbi:hypothetical protein GLOTRDRAFT_128089 [Gloeophyllum trabeum ATCC 11539]|uniref:MYND-type domain-containing protein n=1 Tax=Gloeophyllum trabeum (strain ATCC 11539 / FP-39264 / Madison 617) TaxID=670483 RepID=S7Q9D7_GLOTA|nr:uncharacterized protein GLOTRDRAFT_128089 [Gloeophyllum trabeum ATCC 11539]EPQ56132.1 hypothetical protein GLOTRDRAFT_128089 [Gloeophyllum trabeum ATCC 11539]